MTDEELHPWHSIALELADDLAAALDLCQEYQRASAMLDIPDPHVLQVRELFKKYKREWTDYADGRFVFVDGVDISHSLETVELIEQDGKLRFRPVEKKDKDD